LLAGLTLVAGGHWWSGPARVAGIWLFFAGIMRRASWPRPGRPTVPAALRAALVAALVVELLTLSAGRYFAATATLHNQVYRATGGLVGTLVWSSLVCRALLRATAWASTVPTGPAGSDDDGD